MLCVKTGETSDWRRNPRRPGNMGGGVGVGASVLVRDSVAVLVACFCRS